MGAGKRLVAIVTARGGSKRLPRKNVLPLLGIPLLSRTIRAAHASVSVSRCAVTTDDPEIAALARAEGAVVIRRPTELATDTATGVDTVLHALDELRALGDEPAAFVLLQPTSPLRSEKHIDEAADLFRGSAGRSVISVTVAEHHPHWMFTIDADGALRPLFGKEAAERPRQSLETVMRPNGAIYIIRSSDFREHRSFLVPPIMPYRMTPECSVDIDSALDLSLAAAILAQGR